MSGAAAVAVVAPAVAYRDSRTNGMVEEVARAIPRATIYAKTGITNRTELASEYHKNTDSHHGQPTDTSGRSGRSPAAPGT